MGMRHQLTGQLGSSVHGLLLQMKDGCVYVLEADAAVHALVG